MSNEREAVNIDEAVRFEVQRIKRAMELPEGDKEDLTTYAKEVVSLRYPFTAVFASRYDEELGECVPVEIDPPMLAKLRERALVERKAEPVAHRSDCDFKHSPIQLCDCLSASPSPVDSRELIERLQHELADARRQLDTAEGLANFWNEKSIDLVARLTEAKASRDLQASIAAHEETRARNAEAALERLCTAIDREPIAGDLDYPHAHNDWIGWRKKVLGLPLMKHAPPSSQPRSSSHDR